MGYRNIESTPMLREGASQWKVFANFLRRPSFVYPAKPLPSVVQDLQVYEGEKPRLTWFGHSSYLVQCRGFNLLVDPVFCGYASPVPGMIKAFPGTNQYGAEQMPPIDLMLLTHDHYDHLDRYAQKQMKAKTKFYICPAGVGRHLQEWGITKEKIKELSWGDEMVLSPEIRIRSFTARHFSGRGLNRNATLWSSYLLDFYGFRIYIGGDSGYGSHFKDIGKEAGKIDLAILECGQYNQDWPYIHMLPEEVLKAVLDLHATHLLPVHWAKFGLAYHPWDEPIRRLLAAARNPDLVITTPRIGEPVVLGEHYPQDQWWENL